MAGSATRTLVENEELSVLVTYPDDDDTCMFLYDTIGREREGEEESFNSSFSKRRTVTPSRVGRGNLRT